MKKYLNIVGFLVSGYSFACSPIEELSTQEMILGSEAILIGTVIGFSDKNDVSYALFEIDERIKGDDSYRIGVSKLIKGREVSKNLDNKGQVPYLNSRRTRPGACNSHNYEIGSHYLLFLKDETPYWAAFRPVNEKITGHQDPWVTWVKGFLTGSRLNMTEKSE